MPAQQGPSVIVCCWHHCWAGYFFVFRSDYGRASKHESNTRRRHMGSWVSVDWNTCILIDRLTGNSKTITVNVVIVLDYPPPAVLFPTKASSARLLAARARGAGRPAGVMNEIPSIVSTTTARLSLFFRCFFPLFLCYCKILMLHSLVQSEVTHAAGIALALHFCPNPGGKVVKRALGVFFHQLC